MFGLFLRNLSRCHRTMASLLIVTMVLSIAGSTPCLAASREAVRGANGMVVSPDQHASQAGLDILRSGGNAFDAAIAVAFALAVTAPQAGNLGGGGFILARSAEGNHSALDFRERAPRGLTAEMFIDDQGQVIPELSLKGGLAVGVPGSVAGLAEAHRRWGSRPWKELLQPAIRLAKRGFPVSRWLAASISANSELFRSDQAASRIFLKEGAPPRPGELLIQTDLAISLERIAAEGQSGFYTGPTAKAVSDTVKRLGGVLDLEDLAAYRTVSRVPVSGTYRGHRIVSFPPPSSGGIALLQILKMLEGFDVKAAGAGSSLELHLIAEAERRAFADRSQWLGDPDFVDVPQKGLLDAAYLSDRARTIKPDKASDSAQIGPGAPHTGEPDATLHFSVVDSAGRAVSMTTTLNAWFGSGIVATGTGILLNNEIDDFALAQGVPNLYGLLGGSANAVDGEKRPLSSMTPTIVESVDGKRPILVLGSPGGPRIISSVLQVLINVLDHEMALQEAVDHPRIHHQWMPDTLFHEQRAFPADVARALEARGHRLQPRAPIGNVNAIGLAENGDWLGAADPRKHGTAAGY
jgi:gamma-glutamyltranspeptidase/glutathione hydrolase